MIIRKATAEDIATFSSLTNKPTILAWVGEENGELLGIAGFALSNGRWFGFCDATARARKHKIAIGRAAKRAMEEMKSMGIKYIYADLDRNEPGAERWLRSLGFTIDPRSLSLYRWSAN